MVTTIIDDNVLSRIKQLVVDPRKSPTRSKASTDKSLPNPRRLRSRKHSTFSTPMVRVSST